MIVREYPPYLRFADEWNYFERWFMDVWERRVGHKPKSLLKDKLPDFQEEMRPYGATIKITESYFFEVTFERDEDYTLFVLRWT